MPAESRGVDATYREVQFFQTTVVLQGLSQRQRPHGPNQVILQQIVSMRLPHANELHHTQRPKVIRLLLRCKPSANAKAPSSPMLSNWRIMVSGKVTLRHFLSISHCLPSLISHTLFVSVLSFLAPLSLQLSLSLSLLSLSSLSLLSFVSLLSLSLLTLSPLSLTHSHKLPAVSLSRSSPNSLTLTLLHPFLLLSHLEASLCVYALS